MYGYRQLIKDKVALRKESVDRNTQPGPPRHTGDESLSARRAWIEIAWITNGRRLPSSLSARRAWIEI